MNFRVFVFSANAVFGYKFINGMIFNVSYFSEYVFVILVEKYRDAKSVEEKRNLINDFVDAANKAMGTIEPIDANDIL